jgi:hypothetical protein
MTQIKVDFIEHKMQEYFEYDYNGNMIHGKTARNICIQYPAQLIVDNKRVSILVRAKILKGEIQDSDDPVKYLFYSSNNIFLSRLNKLDNLDIYSKYEIIVFKSDLISGSSKVLSTKEPININITDNLTKILIETVKEYLVINNIVAKVVYQLREYAFNLSPEGHSELKDEMIIYYNFLMDCYEKSYKLFLNSSEIHSDIYIPIIELAKRKKEDNYNYQHLKRKMKDSLFRLNPPDIWFSKPIIPDMIKNKFG